MVTNSLKRNGHSRQLKAIMCLLASVVISCFAGACGSSDNYRKQRAKRLLEAKYNRTFEVVKLLPVYGPLFDPPKHYDVTAYDTNLPKMVFKASIDTEDDLFSDNYVDRMVCRKITQKLEENMDDLPANHYIFSHTIGLQPFVDDPEISIEEYLKQTYSDFIVVTEMYIVPEALDAGKLYNSLKKSYEGIECVNGNITVFILNQKQMDSIREYLDTNDNLYFEYSKLIEGTFSVFVPFDHGTIQMSEEEFKNSLEKLGQ